MSSRHRLEKDASDALASVRGFLERVVELESSLREANSGKRRTLTKAQQEGLRRLRQSAVAGYSSLKVVLDRDHYDLIMALLESFLQRWQSLGDSGFADQVKEDATNAANLLSELRSAFPEKKEGEPGFRLSIDVASSDRNATRTGGETPQPASTFDWRNPAVVMGILTIVLTPVGYSVMQILNNGADIRFTKETVSRVESDVKKLEENEEAHGLEIQGQKQETTKLATSVAAIERDVAAVKTDIENIKTDVSELRADIASIKTDVASIKTVEKLIQQLLEKQFPVSTSSDDSDAIGDRLK